MIAAFPLNVSLAVLAILRLGEVARMSHDLRARLGAAEALLSAKSCPQQSKLQADAVKCLLMRECDLMAPDVKADVAVLLNRIPWHSGHLDMLLSVLATAKAPVPASSRRAQQNWMRIVDMYPKSSWDAFQSTGASLCDVLDTIVDIAARLGLRLPSEDTFHVMNSCALHACQVLTTWSRKWRCSRIASILFANVFVSCMTPSL